MSRSNPNENTNPNPSTRWFEWNGEHGVVRYYDKDKKENIQVGADFTFILLDELSSVRGWDDSNGCGIYSNEVKDTTAEVLVVKSFKGGTLAEGFYKDIKDRVNSAGGQYVKNCYLAYKNDGIFAIGVLRFKGAALGAWMEFTKANRADIYKKAIRISGYTEGKKGRVVFRVPTLALKNISVETDRIAVGLDTELQAFFKSYFKRTKRDQVDTHTEQESSPSLDDDELVNELPEDIADIPVDDIPF